MTEDASAANSLLNDFLLAVPDLARMREVLTEEGEAPGRERQVTVDRIIQHNPSGLSGLLFETAAWQRGRVYLFNNEAIANSLLESAAEAEPDLHALILAQDGTVVSFSDDLGAYYFVKGSHQAWRREPVPADIFLESAPDYVRHANLQVKRPLRVPVVDCLMAHRDGSLSLRCTTELHCGFQIPVTGLDSLLVSRLRALSVSSGLPLHTELIPQNVVPAISPMYLDCRGALVENSSESIEGARRRESLRRRNNDLRTETYHEAGMTAAGEFITFLSLARRFFEGDLDEDSAHESPPNEQPETTEETDTETSDGEERTRLQVLEVVIPGDSTTIRANSLHYFYVTTYGSAFYFIKALEVVSGYLLDSQ